MTEHEYITTTHIARVMMMRHLAHDLLPASDGLPLSVTGITAEEDQEIRRILSVVADRLSSGVSIDEVSE